MTLLSNTTKFYHPNSMPLSLIPHKTIGIGLASWWAMDDTMTAGVDTVLDHHGGVDMVENGTGTYVLNHTDSVFGQVLDFTASSASNLTTPAADAREHPYNSNFSICGWVNFDAFTTHRTIAARADNGASSNATVDWQLIWDATTGYMRFGVMVGSTHYYADWTPTLSTGTWYLMYAEYSATLSRVGISVNNGALVTAGVTGDVNTGGDKFVFGRRSFAAYPWDAYLDGKLSRWGLWTRTLTTDEIGWLYSPSSPRNYSDLRFA